MSGCPSGPVPPAIVLAAGRGERLRPLTDALPKSMVPVGEGPLLGYHLRALAAAGVRRATLVVGYLAGAVEGYVGDGSAFGLRVGYRRQDPPRGTGDALRCALPDGRAEEETLVIYSDVYWGPSPDVYSRLAGTPGAALAAATVDGAGSYGRLETVEGPEGARWLLRIVEKDGRATPGLVNAGAYRLTPAILEALRGVGRSPRGEIELTDALSGATAAGEPIRVLSTDRWIDIGTPEQLAIARRWSSEGFPAPRAAAPEVLRAR